VDWNEQNTKATEFIEEFFKSHDIWEKINPNMKWKQQDKGRERGKEEDQPSSATVQALS
jgi:hypothetical protein